MVSEGKEEEMGRTGNAIESLWLGLEVGFLVLGVLRGIHGGMRE